MASEKIDFKRNPWAGIFTEIANETGKSPQNVRQNWKRNHAPTLAMVKKKVEERQALAEFKKQIAG